jgi:hypothetical protein
VQARRAFIDTAISDANKKYGTNLRRHTGDPTPGYISFPGGMVASWNIASYQPQDVQSWGGQQNVNSALLDIYTKVALYDYGRFVGSPTPGLNLSNSRNQFIASLVSELRSKYQLQTLFYWVEPNALVPIEPIRCLYEGNNNGCNSAINEFKQRLAAYDLNPPMASQAAPSVGGPSTTSPPPLAPVPPPGVPVGLPGAAPQPAAPFGPALPTYQPSSQALPAPSAGGQPAFTPASFLSAFEIAAARTQEVGHRTASYGYLIAGASIDLSALKGPAKLRSAHMQLGSECVTSCVRSGFSGA